MAYTKEQVDRIFELMTIVLTKSTGEFADYAKAYADAALTAYWADGDKGLEMQIPYVLSNLQGWRGDLARETKKELKTFNRYC